MLQDALDIPLYRECVATTHLLNSRPVFGNTCQECARRCRNGGVLPKKLRGKNDVESCHSVSGGTIGAVALPGGRPRPGRYYRRRQGCVWRRTTRRDGGSGQPRPDRKGAICRHRRDWAVPRRRFAAGHLFGDVLVAGFSDCQARRHCALRHVCGHGECRFDRRRVAGNGHRHRSNTGRGRPEREGAADAER